MDNLTIDSFNNVTTELELHYKVIKNICYLYVNYFSINKNVNMSWKKFFFCF